MSIRGKALQHNIVLKVCAVSALVCKPGKDLMSFKKRFSPFEVRKDKNAECVSENLMLLIKFKRTL